MKTAIIIMAMSVLGFTAQAQKTNNKNSATIVLVHGAWADATAWQAVIPVLKAQGHEVIAVNLPGHGSDTTSFAKISLQSYVDVVKNAIGDRKNVILVGHSMAGLVISQVAEEIPGQIKELVYLAAYLPKNGESLLSLAKQDADSHVGKYLQIDQATGSAIVAKDGVVDVFAADAPAQVGEYIANNIKPEPLAPLATPVTLTDGKFGSVRKVYIHTVNDHAVSFSLQNTMVKNNGHISKEYSLPSSHTPFISMPDKLAAILLTASK
ncbi:alpha/beta fold hydrolase [Mucilaginibacter sp. BJC16-A38]|uniref:alpha/beta fold hydrolase n=1 Tax=Mucilaginibacter phenanthrenivorans TaxID=1234842 RepID=UPI0021576A30|nr:alpha/beta fold hydrolase [Mucilaginibacter phenanthrenivorans]MCR8557788.1 alpha/beta fold hydrolase [Mucilaginibacter phenanthrenivorans]